MLWSKMSSRNLVDVWRLIEKFYWRRGGRGVGHENLFRNMTIIIFNSEKQINPHSEAHAEILSRVS